MLIGCKEVSIESKIRNQINKMALAVEEKNGRDFIEYLDENFQDQDGRNKKQIRGILAAIFLQNKTINVTYSIDEIQIQEGIVLASINVKNTAGKLFRTSASDVLIRSQWREHENEWLVYRAQWERID